LGCRRLGSSEAAEGEVCGNARHYGFGGQGLKLDGNGLNAGADYVASVSGCFHDFMKVTDSELGRLCFERGEAVCGRAV
jgi:hypothetical protein